MVGSYYHSVLECFHQNHVRFLRAWKCATGNGDIINKSIGSTFGWGGRASSWKGHAFNERNAVGKAPSQLRVRHRGRSALPAPPPGHEMTHWSQFPELRPFIRFSKHPPTGAFSLCPGSGLNEPRIYLQPSDPRVSMQMTVFCGECQWQLDHFLICIPKASRLSGNTSHRQSGGGYF